MWCSKRGGIARLLRGGLLLVLLLSVAVVSAFAMEIPKPTSVFYVNDFAHLLDEETEKYIEDVNVQLYEATGAQVVVVTLPSLNGASLEEFSTALFREYGIGSREKNNGVLLLLALEEREFRIEVGYGLEGALNDAKTGRIQDEYIIPYLKEDKWNEGIRNGFDAILQEVKKEYQVDVESTAPQSPPEPSYMEDPDNYIFVMIIVSTIIGLLFGKFKLAAIPDLASLVVIFGLINDRFGLGYALLGIFACGLFMLIGWAIIASDGMSSSGSSYSGGYSSRSYSSRSSSGSSYSGGSHHSGGGGRSGGGGSSRKF